ncbi:5-oxoprolinase subunit PxpA [Haliea sp. E17]|uniref:5-oxoprolinase subunit PxpA n=1 Tax=Haliea sp. E17 TaxID=3401576 RepID=UPI003AAD799D
MLLNCDLGESHGNWVMGMDAQVMPWIDQANIACGFHAGDPLTMRNTLALAAEHGVSVGAHPAYPDLVGFGRRSMALSEAEIIADLQFQVAALDGMAQSAGLQLAYVKPHGALYNDMMARAEVRSAILKAIASYYRPLPLMLQATAAAAEHRAEAELLGVGVLFEAFADRCYEDDGSLRSRRLPGAVHSREKMLEQVSLLLHEGVVITYSGMRLPLAADSLCVHGDNQEGVSAIRDIRALVDQR